MFAVSGHWANQDRQGLRGGSGFSSQRPVRGVRFGVGGSAKGLAQPPESIKTAEKNEGYPNRDAA